MWAEIYWKKKRKNVHEILLGEGNDFLPYRLVCASWASIKGSVFSVDSVTIGKIPNHQLKKKIISSKLPLVQMMIFIPPWAIFLDLVLFLSLVLFFSGCCDREGGVPGENWFFIFSEITTLLLQAPFLHLKKFFVVVKLQPFWGKHFEGNANI